MAKRKGPVVRHANNSIEVRAMRRIVKNFAERIENVSHDLVTKGKINKETLGVGVKDIKGDQLLAARKKLVSTIKSGMLERKDMELEIALMAGLVWFLRQEKSKRDRILEEWG